MRRTLLTVVAGAAIGLAGLVPSLLAQPGPPNRFYGSLTVDGAPAPVGTTVTAVVGGKECGSRTTDTAGQYVVDALAGSQTSGCGSPGAEVTFRVGSRTANEKGSWQGGVFTRLDLTVSSQSVPNPAPSAPFTVARLNLDPNTAQCIPPAGGQQCDATRQKLWNGDVDAWTAEQANEGNPAPTPDDVFVLTYEFRIGAGDPAAIKSLAQGLGWPKIYITAIRFKGGTAGEGDEYVEISNVGGAAQDMTGWRLHAVESGADFLFTDGSVLEPGATCRFYTGQPQADSCPGSVNVSDHGVWDDRAGSAELWYDPLALLADKTRYSADPANQPPPPNLRGVAAAG
jgi:hypothetical protein